MFYPERPSHGVNGTATVDCAAYPLDCNRFCPGDNCAGIAEPPPPPPFTRAEVAGGGEDHHLPVRLLLTVSFLSAFLFIFLAVSTVLLYRRRVILRRRRRAATAPLPGDDGFGGDGDEEAGGGGGGEVHHVWYIRTVGLDEATITSIATAEYRAGVGWGGDCAVCLGEFRDGELVRLLPRCSHPFHAPCIDTWLRAHVNCPICRSPVVVPSDVPVTATEFEADGGQEEEHQVFDEMSLSESHAEVSEDSDSSSDTQSEDTTSLAEDTGRVIPKPIRRSASMDSPLFQLVVVPEAQEDAMWSNRKLSNGQEMKVFSVKEKEATGSSSSSCQAGRFGIGRSMSSSGQGFFFSRNGRSRSTVLPL